MMGNLETDSCTGAGGYSLSIDEPNPASWREKSAVALRGVGKLYIENS